MNPASEGAIAPERANNHQNHCPGDRKCSFVASRIPWGDILSRMEFCRDYLIPTWDYMSGTPSSKSLKIGKTPSPHHPPMVGGMGRQALLINISSLMTPQMY